MTIALALDIGATNARVAVVEMSEGSIDDRAAVPMAGSTPRAVLAQCRELAEDLLDGRRPSGVGVSVCELVSPDGSITSHATLDWTSHDLVAAFGDLADVAIVSDVVAAGLAEYRFGATRGLSSFLHVNIGSGLSSSLFLEGEPWRGEHGAAVLLGEEPLGAERLGSGKGLAARAGLLDGASVLEAAERGDPRCAEICDSGAAAVGNALGFAINLLDPAAVVLSGGVVHGSRRFREGLIASVRATTRNDQGRATPILLSVLGDDPALIGAALNTLREVRT